MGKKSAHGAIPGIYRIGELAGQLIIYCRLTRTIQHDIYQSVVSQQKTEGEDHIGRE